MGIPPVDQVGCRVAIRSKSYSMVFRLHEVGILMLLTIERVCYPWRVAVAATTAHDANGQARDMLLPVGKPHHDRYCSPVQPGCGPDIESRIGGCGCPPLHVWLLHAAGKPRLGHHKAKLSVCYKL